jgi:hypothetical protein
MNYHTTWGNIPGGHTPHSHRHENHKSNFRGSVGLQLMTLFQHGCFDSLLFDTGFEPQAWKSQADICLLPESSGVFSVSSLLLGFCNYPCFDFPHLYPENRGNRFVETLLSTYTASHLPKKVLKKYFQVYKACCLQIDSSYGIEVPSLSAATFTKRDGIMSWALFARIAQCSYLRLLFWVPNHEMNSRS